MRSPLFSLLGVALLVPFGAVVADGGTGGADAAADTAAAAGAADLLLYVRVESPSENVFRGWVRVPSTVDVTTYNNGNTYALEGATPLAALVVASRAGGFEALVTDEYLGIDFSVDAIDGYWQAGQWWWDYRVDYVSTYYGAHVGWLEAGPPLRSGDEVLWYLETIGTLPMRARASPLAPSPEGCAHAVTVEMSFPDVVHRPGTAWPTPTWTAVPYAAVTGTVNAPVAAGRALVLAPAGGATAWAEREALPVGNLDLVRSDRLALACPG